MTERESSAPTNDPLPWSTLVPVGIALLGPVAVWALHLNVSYFLVQPVCVMGGQIALHIASVVSVGLVLIPLLTSIRLLRTHGGSFRDNLEGRDDWLAFVGLLGIALSLISGVAVIAQWTPMFVLDPCGVNAP
ncbi:MAG: hypothetical protein M3220_06095 [Chloroflexota bacterium]|nr:hypothetical protein [Chloroflexota bacterium]